MSQKTSYIFRAIRAQAREIPLGLAGHPTVIEGEPVRYYRKECFRAGRWHHPNEVDVHEVDVARLDKWVSHFKRFVENGAKVFIPPRHQGFNAKQNFGWVIGLEREGESLYAILQIIGEDGFRAVARNDVSVYVGPAVDNTGHVYDEALQHVALCPNPAMHGLGPFVPLVFPEDQLSQVGLAASSGVAAEAPVLSYAADKESDMNRETLLQLLGMTEEQTQGKTDEQLLAMLRQRVTEGVTAAQELASVRQQLTTLQQQVTQKDQAIQQITQQRDGLQQRIAASADQPSSTVLSLMADNHRMRIEGLRDGGKITTGLADGLMKLAGLGENQAPSVIAMSSTSEGGPSLLVQILDLLKEHPAPPPIGPKPIKMSRGGESDDEDAADATKAFLRSKHGRDD